jgi:hypothetical protein
MRSTILAFVLAALALMQAGCAADLHAGPRNGGLDAGAAVGPPVVVSPRP